MFEVSVVLLVPGVELVALVLVTSSTRAGTAEAVTPSNSTRNLVRSTPKLEGAMTMRQVLAVAADSATAEDVETEYPALAMTDPFRGWGGERRGDPPRRRWRPARARRRPP